MFLCPSGRGWRVENMSRTYSRLRDIAGLADSEDIVVLLSIFSPLNSRAALHLDDGELADAQDFAQLAASSDGSLKGAMIWRRCGAMHLRRIHAL